MASFPASNSTCCSVTCPDPVVLNIPGPTGGAGAAGAAGASGQPAYAYLTAGFTMPAEQANVTITVTSTAWMAVGEILYIETAGWFQVVTVVNSQSVIIKNLENTAASAYTPNVASGTVIANNKIVTPSGLQGPSFGGASQTILGTGSPEGAQLGSPGWFYFDITAPATPVWYVKVSGTNTTTGWIAMIV